MEIQGNQVIPDLLERGDPMDDQEIQGTVDPRDPRGTRDHEETEDPKVPPENQGNRDRKETWGNRAPLYQGTEDQSGRKETEGIEGDQATSDQQDQGGNQVHRETEDQEVTWGSKER